MTTEETTLTKYQNLSDDPQSKKEENLSLVLFVLGFVLGIVWIINYFLHSNSISENAQKYAKFSLYLFLIILLITFCIFGFSLIMTILSAIISARPK